MIPLKPLLPHAGRAALAPALLGPALAALMGVLLAPALLAQPTGYTVTRILPVGTAFSWVGTSLNDQGTVVGWSQFFDGSTSLQSWVWTSEAGLVYLPDPPGQPRSRAIDLNEAGVITGDGGFDSGVAWRWDGTGYEFLGVLEGGTCSTASAINELDEIAGTSRNCNSFLIPPDAFVDDATGGGLVEVFAGGWATRMNDLGVVVGYASNAAWRFVPGSGGEFLGNLGSKPLTWAYGVNNAGAIVGEAAAANGNGHVPWIFTDAGGMQEIGDFGGSAGAVDINDAGTVIGNSGAVVSQPWIWTAQDGLTFINPLIDPAETIGILDVVKINASGQILARIIDNVTGDLYPVVLTPELDDGPWTDIGFALPGARGEPSLSATGTLVAGTPVSLMLGDALPDSTAFMMLGFERLDLPFKGGVLVPAFSPPDGTLITLPTSPLGAFTLNGTWPAGIPSGSSLYAQTWIVDDAAVAGLSASNALEGAVP